MPQSTILVLLLSLLVASCGQEVRSRKTKEIEIPITEAEAFAIKTYQNFSCESLNGENCPAGVGRILILNYKSRAKSRLCSGFLISENKFMTNNHCLSTQKECDDSVISIFNGAGAEIVGCKSVIISKSDSRRTEFRSQDFTILELKKRMNITPFRLSPNSARVGDNLNAWVVDQMDAFNARITQLDCLYGQESRSMVLVNCPAIQGNSGSPVVNSQNEIVGILWGGSENDLDEKVPLATRRIRNEKALVTDIRFFRAYAE
jgi:V8-like Glu-specific endopeptidase